MKNIFKVLAILVLGSTIASCGKFLDRPSEDNYNAANFYQNDEQMMQGVNYLYNSPWYDFQRGFIKIGEVTSGNYYIGNNPYTTLTFNSTDDDLVNMSYSLWAVNGHANTVIDNILAAMKNGSQASEEVANRCIAEALVWKAMAYFYLVRTFGEVPIVHNNTDLLNENYNSIEKRPRSNVYDYIIMTLDKAMDLFAAAQYYKTGGWGNYERIDYYAAEALLSKVYLTKAGLSGSLNSEDLDMAKTYAWDVINNSGRELLPTYSDLFRLTGYNATGECLISWLWENTRNPWTAQNTLQSDLAMQGFDELGDCWGGWGGPTVDLQEAFGVSAKDDPSKRVGEKDSRRKATMMMAGDKYEYFWTDKGGFDYLKFIYDKNNYGKGGPGGQLQCGTGANNVKHLYGDSYDHEQAVGALPENMCNKLPTHILRLADIYLVYAESCLLTGDQSEALDYVNKVRVRAGVDSLKTITYDDIWKERRLELAYEGDRWYDFVRRSYYDVDACIAELKAQKRSCFIGLDDVFKEYIGKDFDYSGSWDASNVVYISSSSIGECWDNPTVTKETFTLPFPTEDVVFNGNLKSDAEAVEVDVYATYSYDYIDED